MIRIRHGFCRKLLRTVVERLIGSRTQVQQFRPGPLAYAGSCLCLFLTCARRILRETVREDVTEQSVGTLY